MKTEDLYWLAGYLEGEGTFNAGGAKNSDGEYTSIIVQVSSVDVDVLEKVRRIIDANRVFPVKSSRGSFNKQQMYRVQVAGVEAINLILELRPLMGERRKEQMIMALAKCARVQRLLEEVRK